jgi:hypothetical protein
MLKNYSIVEYFFKKTFYINNPKTMKGAVNLRFDHLQDIAEPFELRFPFYRIGWLP